MILGATRLYPGSLHFLPWTLPPLCRITDRQLFLLDRLSVSDVEHVLPAGCVTAPWCGGGWDHEAQLNALLREADKLAPEWLVYPDSDEILPVGQFPVILDACRRQGKLGVEFSYAVPFGGLDYQLARHLVPFGPHMKVLLWRPGLTFSGGVGFCIPRGRERQAIQSVEPLLHLYYMTEEARSERRRQGRTDVWGMNPVLVPAPPQWSRDYTPNAIASRTSASQSV